MKHRDHEQPIDPEEWNAQERALRAERLGEPDAGDADLRGYRSVARVLARPQPVALPPDFARQVARRAVREHTHAADTRIEGGLATALLSVLGIALLVLAMLQGPQWWQALTALVPDATLSNRWLLSLLACAAVTWALGRAGERPAAPR